MTPVEIAWLAGILEGEGYFASHRGSPYIKVDMTDRDIIARIAALAGMAVRGPRQPKGKPTYKPVWSCYISGHKAIGVMLTVYTHLGARRRAAVRGAVATWRSSPYPTRLSRERARAKGLDCGHEDGYYARGQCRSCYSKRYMRAWRRRRTEAA